MLLSCSKIYDLFQKFMGSSRGRLIFSARYIRAKKGDRILDIGCGTAEALSVLPEVKYYGFDPNPRYIETARSRYCDRNACTFVCASIDDVMLDSEPQFDIVLALGVLHHLDDGAVIRLANLAKRSLKQRGRLILVDPCLVENQSIIARSLALLDRGKYVRDANGYINLINNVFTDISSEVNYNLTRFPYTHLIIECVVE